MILIELNKPFKDSKKGHSFALLARQLHSLYAQSACHSVLIGNLQVGKFNFDAVWIHDSAIVLFEFKHGWGEIKVRPEGPWLIRKKTIWSGFDSARFPNDNPHTQMYAKRNVLYGYLRKHLQMEQIDIACFVCFDGDVSVNDSSRFLSRKAQWLTLRCIEYTTYAIQAQVRNNQIINDWPSLLRFFRIKQDFRNGSTILPPFMQRKEGFFKRILRYLVEKMEYHAA